MPTDKRFYRSTLAGPYVRVPRDAQAVPGVLPFPWFNALSTDENLPTEGPPIVLEGPTAGFDYYPMIGLRRNAGAEYGYGDETMGLGCWTDGRDDCSVVLAVQPGGFFFTHLNGGTWVRGFSKSFWTWIDDPAQACIVICSKNLHNVPLLKESIDPEEQLGRALFYATYGATFALNTTQAFWGWFGELREP